MLLIKSILMILLLLLASYSAAQNRPELIVSYWPDPVIYGQLHTLRWASENAESCKNSAGTSLALNGAWQTVTQIIGNGSSTITCSGPGGSITKTATYEILPDPQEPAPLLQVTHSQENLKFGDTQTAYWQSSNTIDCQNSAGSSLVLNGEWATKVTFLGEGSSTITCTGPGGSITQTDTYNVMPADEVAGYVIKVDSLISPDLVNEFSSDTYQIDGITYGNSALMYHRWPIIEGLVDLYSVSGKEEYIALAIDIAKAYINQGIINGEYLSWYSTVGGYNNIDHDHVEWRAGAAIARIVYEASHSDLPSSYTPDINFLSDFLEKNVWVKWSEQSDLKTTMVTHFIARIGKIALALYQHTGKSEYLNYINYKGLELKNSLEHINVAGIPEGLYNIRCRTNNTDCGIASSMDVSHASDTVSFIFELYSAGYVFNDKDIQRLANTVKHRMWNKNLQSPAFNENVNGSGELSDIGRYQGGWIALAAIDSELLNVYRTWANNNLNLVEEGASDYNIQIYGNLAKSLSHNR